MYLKVISWQTASHWPYGEAPFPFYLIFYDRGYRLEACQYRPTRAMSVYYTYKGKPAQLLVKKNGQVMSGLGAMTS